MTKFKQLLFAVICCVFLFLFFGFQDSISQPEVLNKQEFRDAAIRDFASDIRLWGPIVVALLAAVIAAIYTFYMQIWGIAKVVRTKLKDAESKAIIKQQIDSYFLEKKTVEATQILKIRAKKFYVISPNTASNKWIDIYLKKEGFVNVVTVASELTEIPATNELVVFNNEKGDLKEETIIKTVQENPNAEFFYFNMTGKGWRNQSAPILKFANNFDTLTGHLTNALKNNNYGF